MQYLKKSQGRKLPLAMVPAAGVYFKRKNRETDLFEIEGVSGRQVQEGGNSTTELSTATKANEGKSRTWLPGHQNGTTTMSP